MARTIDAKINFMKEHAPKNYQPMVDKNEVCKLLNISLSTLNDWIKNFPDMPYSKKGKKYGFDAETILNWYWAKNER